MQNILNTGVVFFIFSSFHCGGEATETSPWAHLPLIYFTSPCPVCAGTCVCVCVCVCSCTRVCVCVPVMLMYALCMTLIDLAALLAQYSFFPNLSLS